MEAPATSGGGRGRFGLPDDQRCDRDIGGIRYVGHHRHRRPHPGQRGARHADLHRARDGRGRNPDGSAGRRHRHRRAPLHRDRAHAAVAYGDRLIAGHHRHAGQFRDDHLRATGDRLRPRRPLAHPGRRGRLAGGGHAEHRRLADLHAGQPDRRDHGRGCLRTFDRRCGGRDRRSGREPAHAGHDIDLDPQPRDRRRRRSDARRHDAPQRRCTDCQAGCRHAGAHGGRHLHGRRDRGRRRTDRPRRPGTRERAPGDPWRRPRLARPGHRVRFTEFAGARRARAARSGKRIDHHRGRGLHRGNAPAAADRGPQQRPLERRHRHRVADGGGIAG